MQPRPLVFNHPPPPQFQNVWTNPNTETYMQPPTTMNPITQYVQVRIAYVPILLFIVVIVPSGIISSFHISGNSIPV